MDFEPIPLQQVKVERCFDLPRSPSTASATDSSPSTASPTHFATYLSNALATPFSHSNLTDSQDEHQALNSVHRENEDITQLMSLSLIATPGTISVSGLDFGTPFTTRNLFTPPSTREPTSGEKEEVESVEIDTEQLNDEGQRPHQPTMAHLQCYNKKPTRLSHHSIPPPLPDTPSELKTECPLETPVSPRSECGRLHSFANNE